MIRAVLFDLDGTLLRQAIDFQALRRDIGAGDVPDIIEYLRGLPPELRAEANAVLEEHERRAALRSQLNEGAGTVLDWLRARNLPSAVYTRNSRDSFEAAVRRHGLEIAVAVCRGDAPPKPSPEPVLMAAEILGVPPAGVLAVGDYAFDTESAIRAGALSVYLSPGHTPKRETHAHFQVSKLVELIPLIEGLGNGTIVPGPPRLVEAVAP